MAKDWQKDNRVNVMRSPKKNSFVWKIPDDPLEKTVNGGRWVGPILYITIYPSQLRAEDRKHAAARGGAW